MKGNETRSEYIIPSLDNNFKLKNMNRIEELLMKLCYGEGLSEQEYQEYKKLSSK